jgi:hypothetical protein
MPRRRAHDDHAPAERLHGDPYLYRLGVQPRLERATRDHLVGESGDLRE